MELPCTIVLSFAVIFIFIELSEQFDCLPDGNPIPGVYRPAPSNSPESSNSAGPTSLAEPHIRARSRSETRTHSSRFILGFDPKDLRFIRLISNTDSHSVLEIRKYTFPPDKPINLRGARNELLPMPNEERYVLTTSTGDVVAIFEQNNKLLRGIYIRNPITKRAKINMNNGFVDVLNEEEIADIPVGRRNPILENFKVVHVNDM